MDELREKCPWDREQTWETIRHLTIEETSELSDAILENDAEEIKKELGDILLHIVFYAKIGDEKGQFDIGNVIDSLCEKLIRRHPHIYGDVVANNADVVKQNWEQIKLTEKSAKPKTLLSGLPKGMPSLVKAYRMQEKVAQVGFDWPQTQQVIDKLSEEISELNNCTNKEEEENEFGDILFTLVNYARHRGINPDDALEKTNRKFKQRFEYIESNINAQGKKMEEQDLDYLEALWQEAKKQ